MNSTKVGVFLALGLAVASASLSAPASAQYGGSYGRDPYGNGSYGNGSYGRGSYGGGYNNSDAQQFFDRFRDDSRQFRKDLNNAADDSRYNNDSRRDRMKQLGQEFDDSVNQLRRNFKDGKNVSYDVQRVLNYGNSLNSLMQRSRFNGNVQQSWSRVASDLNLLSRNSYSRGRY